MLDATERDEVANLLAAIELDSGEESLTEEAHDRLRAGTAHHALRRAHGRLTGYAVLGVGSVLEVDPAFGSCDLELVSLLEARDEPVSLLLRGIDDATVERIAARGWRPRRSLHRMHRALPAPPPPPSHLEVRPFRPGVDEARWVRQNNAAFADHPTQGTMTVEKVVAREQAPWFDPEDFLLFVDHGELVASCWTKVRRRSTDAVGEIHVVSVAPGAQGRGLGRLAVLAGLEHLWRRGIGLAELYVEDTNHSAIALYEALGFVADERVVELRHGE